jgi:hypothetical protein
MVKDTVEYVYTLERVIKDLEQAVNVCYNVDEEDGDYEKTYPFAAGYSRSAMQNAVADLKKLLG